MPHQILNRMKVSTLLLVLSAGAPAQIVFEPPMGQPLTEVGDPLYAASGDVNGDGSPDVVVRPDFLAGHVSVFLNDGAGGFAAPVDTSVPFAGQRLADVDADGRDDLVLYGGQVDISVRLSLGDGSFGAPHDLAVPAPTLAGVTVELVDLTGDGLLDALIGTGPSIFYTTVTFSLAPGLGDGSFGALVPVQTTQRHDPTALACGDLDGDGRTDFVVPGWNVGAYHFRVFLNAGSGAFTAHDVAVSYSAERLTIVDVDADGFLDVVGAEEIGERVFVHIGGGDGSLQDGIDVGQASLAQVATDLDDDDVPDLAGIDYAASELRVLRGTGDGGFEPSLVVTGLPRVMHVLPEDVDGDRRTDLVLVSSYPSELTVLRNHTYRASEPFDDLGHGLRGAAGYPIQLASGHLGPDSELAYRLAGAAPDGIAWLVLGTRRMDAAFQSGVLVPEPAAMVGPLPLGGATELRLEGRWPAALPSGTAVWSQFWVQESGGFAASSAVRAVSP